MPTCGPLLILPPAVKRWGPPTRQGLCSHLTHLWSTSDFAPRFEAVGTSRRQGLCSYIAHLWATSDSAPRCEAVGTPPGGRGYVATLPTCGPLLILPPALKRWGPPTRQGLCSHLTHLWSTHDFAPRFEAVGTSRRQGLCSHIAHLWATSDCAPRREAVGTPPGGRGYVATLPTCGPLLILPPALKRWGPPIRQGLCSHLTHLWSTSDFAPRCEAVGTPRRQGLCSHIAHLWATSDSAPRFEAVGTPPGGRGYVATLPTCGPLLILPRALKRWGPPTWQGLCSHLAHSWATFDSAPRFEAVGTPQTAGVM